MCFLDVPNLADAAGSTKTSSRESGGNSETKDSELAPK